LILLLTFILSSSHDDPSFWGSIGAVAGVYLFYRGFRILQRKRLIMNTPSSKVRSASVGLVEVNGLATGPYTMTAPITGVPCYYFRTIAWQLKQSGKNKEWEKVAEESLHLPFYLDDNTGRVLVNPQAAELDIHRDFHEEFSGSFFGSHPELPERVDSFLARHGVSNDKKLKVDEYCIKPKNALFILGTLAQNPGVNVTSTPVRTLSSDAHKVSFRLGSGLAGAMAGAMDSGSTLTVTRSVTFSAFKDDVSPQQVMPPSGDTPPASAADMTQQGRIAAALTKAGITNPAAWAAAGMPYPGVSVNAASPAGTAAAPAEAFDPHPPVVLMKGTHNPAFFISWRSQKDVLMSLEWKSAAMIWGGPALTLLCLYILAAHYGW
jgi:hypothetical protein